MLLRFHGLSQGSAKLINYFCGRVQVRLEPVVGVLLEEGVEPLEEGVVEAQVEVGVAHGRRELANHVPGEDDISSKKYSQIGSLFSICLFGPTSTEFQENECFEGHSVNPF